MKQKKSRFSNVKNVLIVDDEKLFLASLTEGMLEFADEFRIITASNGKIALETLQQQEIDLVVTDLKMPEFDGFQLLAEMTNDFPNIPVIVMTAFGTPEIEKNIQKLDAYSYLEKPIDYQLLAGKIRDGLTHNSEGHLTGIMLSSFLQLLQMEQKTCALKITTENRKGTLYFSNGNLIEAVCRKEYGEKAAHKIVCWEDAEIEIVNSYKKIQRRIDKPLQNLLMDAAKEKDEAALLDERERLETDEILSEEFILSESSDEILIPLSETKSDDSSNEFEPTGQAAVTGIIKEKMSSLMQIDGAIGVALVDLESGKSLGTSGGSGVDLETAAAGNTEFIRLKKKVIESLGLEDRIEDILITLGGQHHLVRPLKSHENLFLYLVLEREQSNLAMARFKMNQIEDGVYV